MTKQSSNKAGSSRCGFVAVVGRPNVGKSTLINHILKQKISITSRKPQTTRHRILGINTQGFVQTIYVDTPGIHRVAKSALNKYMNRTAVQSIADVDVIVLMIDSFRWHNDDELVLEKIKNAECPVILVLNKVDKIKDKGDLLPFIEEMNEKFKFADIVPISAKNGTNVSELEKLITGYLPEGEHLFPDDQITDRSDRFLAAEIVREKIMRYVGEEVPYALTTEIEQFKQEGKLLRIAVIVYVEKPGQKLIIIGAKGERLKEIATQARVEMEKLFDTKVFLQVWIKVKNNWSDDAKTLHSLGYE